MLFSFFSFFPLGTPSIVHDLLEDVAEFKEKTTDKSVKFAFNALRWVVTLGCAIYPIGYLLKGQSMELVYNIGDLINKILFGLIIWYAARYNFN